VQASPLTDLEEHGVLLSWLALEAQMWCNYELDIVSLETRAEAVEVILSHGQSKLRTHHRTGGRMLVQVRLSQLFRLLPIIDAIAHMKDACAHGHAIHRSRSNETLTH
jgi:hypothetical protein